MELKELWEEHKRRKEEEEEWKRRQKAGEIGIDEPSPEELRGEERSAEETRREAAEAARGARKRERRGRPGLAKEAIGAAEEAKRAEERAAILETELYGRPLVKPEEIIRDRWGREIERRPLAGKRREEAVKLEFAEKKTTERALRLIEQRAQLAEEEIKEYRTKKRREKVLGPARAVVKGVAGAVEGVGRGVAGFGVRTGPYQMQPPQVLPTSQLLPRPSGMDLGLSSLRDLQMKPGPRLSLFPTSGFRKPRKKKNTYNRNLNRIRRKLFG